MVLALIVSIFAGCSKKKVRRSKLEGKVYEVVGVSFFEGVSYAGWTNAGNTDPSEGGVQSTSASGTWDFTDLENIVVNMTYTYPDSEVAWGYSITGRLDMIGNNSLSLNIDGDLDYGNYPVHENKGKKLTLVLAESISSYEEFVTFVMLEKQ